MGQHRTKNQKQHTSQKRTMMNTQQSPTYSLSSTSTPYALRKPSPSISRQTSNLANTKLVQQDLLKTLIVSAVILATLFVLWMKLR